MILTLEMSSYIPNREEGAGISYNLCRMQSKCLTHIIQRFWKGRDLRETSGHVWNSNPTIRLGVLCRITRSFINLFFLDSPRWKVSAFPVIKIPPQNKKASEKALIPLPPTGLVSFFCANPDVVQTNLQPRRAVGLCRGSAIAQNVKFWRDVQRGCTAVLRTAAEGEAAKCPDSLGV